MHDNVEGLRLNPFFIRSSSRVSRMSSMAQAGIVLIPFSSGQVLESSSLAAELLGSIVLIPFSSGQVLEEGEDESLPFPRRS